MTEQFYSTELQLQTTSLKDSRNSKRWLIYSTASTVNHTFLNHTNGLVSYIKEILLMKFKWIDVPIVVAIVTTKYIIDKYLEN